MITMEFEELQKIWDSQNNRPVYTLDEKALHNRILAKKRQAYHIANTTELMSIIINCAAGGLILRVNGFKQHTDIFMYVLAAWMFCTALYVCISRIRRIQRDKDRFEQSMRGDLDHAISTAAYQVNFIQILRWNILPTGLLTLLVVWNAGKSIWIVGVLLLLLMLVYYASGFENRVHKARKRALQILREKLEKEV
jgi:high-affinity Fe2+/Pb2+ permease